MARYSLFVLKVLLNTSHLTNWTSVLLVEREGAWARYKDPVRGTHSDSSDVRHSAARTQRVRHRPRTRQLHHWRRCPSKIFHRQRLLTSRS